MLQCSRKGILRWSGHVARTEKVEGRTEILQEDQLERRHPYYKGKVLRRNLSFQLFFWEMERVVEGMCQDCVERWNNIESTGCAMLSAATANYTGGLLSYST
jgi:hypothetical protein